jgi:hypothetical protein
MAGFFSDGTRYNIEKRDQRFWEKVTKLGPDDCWLYQGALDSGGYGCVWIGHKSIGAHRFAFLSSGDTIPNDMLVLHKCDVRNCCNPTHLFLGTQQDNVIDRNHKGRANQPIGERNGLAKLREEDVIAILKDKRTYRKIARDYGVHNTAISSIKNGRSWSYLTRRDLV